MAETRTKIFENIVHERKCQDDNWGEQEHEDPVWLTILTEEVGEVAKEVLRGEFGLDDGPQDDFDQAMRKSHIEYLKLELTHVAAVAVAWLEKLEAVSPPVKIYVSKETMAELDQEYGYVPDEDDCST